MVKVDNFRMEAAAVSLRLPSDEREQWKMSTNNKKEMPDSLIPLYKGYCESPYYSKYQG
jgi:hypothetical protein